MKFVLSIFSRFGSATAHWRIPYSFFSPCKRLYTINIHMSCLFFSGVWTLLDLRAARAPLQLDPLVSLRQVTRDQPRLRQQRQATRNQLRANPSPHLDLPHPQQDLPLQQVPALPPHLPPPHLPPPRMSPRASQAPIRTRTRQAQQPHRPAAM